MTIKRKVLIAVFALLLGIFLIDFIKLNFGTKKHIKLNLKNGSVIQGNLADGIFSYGRDNLTIFKWEVSSSEEIKK